MDEYTKFILTVIAVGIVSLNVQLFNGDIITSANAEVGGKDSRALLNDRDFVDAVQKIVVSGFDAFIESNDFRHNVRYIVSTYCVSNLFGANQVSCLH